MADDDIVTKMAALGQSREENQSSRNFSRPFPSQAPSPIPDSENSSSQSLNPEASHQSQTALERGRTAFTFDENRRPSSLHETSPPDKSLKRPTSSRHALGEIGPRTSSLGNLAHLQQQAAASKSRALFKPSPKDSKSQDDGAQATKTKSTVAQDKKTKVAESQDDAIQNIQTQSVQSQDTKNQVADSPDNTIQDTRTGDSKFEDTKFEHPNTEDTTTDDSDTEVKMRFFRGTPARPAPDAAGQAGPSSRRPAADRESPFEQDVLNAPQTPSKNSTALAFRDSPYSAGPSATPTTQTSTPKQTLFDTRREQQQPIGPFTPDMWQYFNSDETRIEIDLYWPREFGGEDEHDESDDASHDSSFPLEGLRPMTEFRKLRVLHLTGMLDSYQKYIWQTCWLNPELEDLTLEMVLEPELAPAYKSEWLQMDGDWEMRGVAHANHDYKGDDAQGILNTDYGFSEYLDSKAIKEGKTRAHEMGSEMLYLSIVKLTLAGFVVDADPFLRYFNPLRIREINFKRDCVDAGFFLPRALQPIVSISASGTPRGPMRPTGGPTASVATAQTITPVNLRDLKIITIGPRGNIVDRQDAFPNLQGGAQEQAAPAPESAIKKGKGKGKGKGKKGKGKGNLV